MITKNTECDSPEPQSVFSPLEYFIQSLDSPPMVWEWELEAQDCLCSLCNWQKRKADEVKGWKGWKITTRRWLQTNQPHFGLTSSQQPKLGQEWKNECKEMGEQRDAIRPPSESTPITARPCFSTCWGGMGGTTTVRTLTRGSILREMSSIQCSVFEPTHPKWSNRGKRFLQATADWILFGTIWTFGGNLDFLGKFGPMVGHEIWNCVCHFGKIPNNLVHLRPRYICKFICSFFERTSDIFRGNIKLRKWRNLFVFRLPSDTLMILFSPFQKYFYFSK